MSPLPERKQPRKPLRTQQAKPQKQPERPAQAERPLHAVPSPDSEDDSLVEKAKKVASKVTGKKGGKS